MIPRPLEAAPHPDAKRPDPVQGVPTERRQRRPGHEAEEPGTPGECSQAIAAPWEALVAVASPVLVLRVFSALHFLLWPMMAAIDTPPLFCLCLVRHKMPRVPPQIHLGAMRGFERESIRPGGVPGVSQPAAKAAQPKDCHECSV